MIYGIDATSANKKQRTGVEWYAYQLIQHMKEHALEDDERVFLYTNEALREPLDALPKKWEEHVLGWPFPAGWMQGRMSWEMVRRPPNVLFVPAQGLPIVSPANAKKQQATVTTIHDVGFKRLPALYNKSVQRRLVRATERAIKKSTHLLTVSDFTKRELMELYNVDPERITVTHLAVDREVFYPREHAEEKSMLQKYQISRPFFLFVGRLESKKNVSTLIEAFELFKRRRGIGDPYDLVLVGSAGFGGEVIVRRHERSSQKRHIHRLGYVPSSEVATLMSAASAYLFPSRYEGFGLPNLEAMACETPLITADIPPHREVVGEEAGLFVSPVEPTAWAMAMRRIAEEERLVNRLVSAGRERLKEFSWEKTAEETWRVLRNAV